MRHRLILNRLTAKYFLEWYVGSHNVVELIEITHAEAQRLLWLKAYTYSKTEYETIFYNYNPH